MPTVTYNGISLIKEIHNDQQYLDFIRITEDGGKFKIKELDYELVDALPFSEGMAAIVTEDDKIQFIDEGFNEVFTLNDIEYAGSFSDGLAPVSDVNVKWGYIDPTGKNVITCQYDYVSQFSEQHAIVASYSHQEAGNLNFKLIDLAGNVVFDFKDKFELFGLLKEGVIAVYDGSGWGYVNTKGEKVISPKDSWSSVTSFHNGYASFQEDRDWGVVNKEGEVTIRAKYDHPIVFDNGLAPIIEDNEVGFIDDEGTKIIRPEFEDVAFSFACGNAVVRDGKYYVFIGKDGKPINNNDCREVGVDSRFAYKRRRPTFYRLMQRYETHLKTIQSQYLDVENILSRTIGDLSRLYSGSGNILATLNTLGFTDNIEKSLNGSGSYFHKKQYADSHINLPLNVSYNDIYVHFDKKAKKPVRNEYGYISHYRSDIENPTNGVKQIKFNLKLKDKAYKKQEVIADMVRDKLLSLGYIENPKRNNEYLDALDNKVATLKTSSNHVILFLYFDNKEEEVVD
jgi:hypothetical protein